jgi:hypothetical protein
MREHFLYLSTVLNIKNDLGTVEKSSDCFHRVEFDRSPVYVLDDFSGFGLPSGGQKAVEVLFGFVDGLPAHKIIIRGFNGQRSGQFVLAPARADAGSLNGLMKQTRVKWAELADPVHPPASFIEDKQTNHRGRIRK